MKRWRSPQQLHRHGALSATPSLEQARRRSADVAALRITLNGLQCAHDTLVAEVCRLRQENLTLRGQLEAAKAKIVELVRQVFGRKSER